MKSTKMWIVLGCLLTATAAFTQTATNGVANGIAIDGFLVAQQPPGTNDWLDGPTPCVPGTGGLLNNDGNAKLPMAAQFLFITNALDGVGNGDNTRFTGGSKFNQSPGAWSWDCQKPNDKVDINHGLLAISVDAQSNLWAVVGGDRSSNNGDAYIDFEFLQNSLVKSNSCPGGGFASAGPHGGRTVGDLLVTIHFVNGGVIPDFFALIWTNKVGSTTEYEYRNVTPPAGTAFVAQNDVPVDVCFGAYGGSTTYDVNQFAEAGVNLSALIPALKNNHCFTISTVFIKTKTSQSDTAELKDFLEPIQLNLCVDSEPPVITGCPSPVTVQCDASVPAADITLVTAVDNCTSNPVITWVSDVSTGSCPKTITRTYRATDGCLNSAVCTQTITVHDLTAPVLSGVPTNATYQCLSEVPAAPTVTATDNCDGSVTVGFAETPEGPACNRTITRTWTATDSCGNTASASRTITVHDTTAPVLTKGSIGSCYNSVSAAEAAAIAATGTNDNCGGVVSLGAVVSGECTAVITVTGTDVCGNSASVTYTTKVDVTPPVLTGVPANITYQCAGEIPTPPTVTGNDNCDGAVSVTYTNIETGTACNRTITRTWSAVDGCGNSVTTNQVITVADTTPPELSGQGADGTVECPGTPAFTAPSGVDNCGGSVTITFTNETTTLCGNTYRVKRTWVGTDACGNKSTPVSQTITVVDTTPPTLSGQGADGTVECPATPAFTAPSGADTCGGAVTITFTNETTALCGNTYRVKRTWVGTDACGNKSTPVSQTITVVDTTPPTLSGQGADGTVECPATPVFTAPSGVDSCGGDVAITYTNETTTLCGNTYRVKWTWVGTDACGNPSAPVSQTITVVDTTAPTLTCVPDKSLACESEVAFDAPSASDTCDVSPLVTVVSTVTNSVVPLTVTRTWMATDACGNSSATCSQTVTVLLCSEGCTPGYWKNHPDSWSLTGYSAGQKLEAVFDFSAASGPVAALGSRTLMEALSFQGGTNLRGAAEILLRAGVAALLSAAHPGVGYELSEAEVLNRVNTALASGDRAAMLVIAKELDVYNNLKCPLN